MQKKERLRKAHLKVFIIEIITKGKACQYYNDIKTEKGKAMYANRNDKEPRQTQPRTKLQIK